MSIILLIIGLCTGGQGWLIAAAVVFGVEFVVGVLIPILKGN